MRNMLLFKKSFLIVCLLSTVAISFSQVTEKWAKTQPSDPNLRDAASGLVVDQMGNVYVTGSSIGNGTGYDYATIRYNNDGNKQWVKRYNGPANDQDEAVAIATDFKGNVYVTGWSTSAGAQRDYATIKYDEQGNTKWVKRYNGPGNDLDEPTALVVDSCGNVYVTGYSTGNGTGYDYTTIKYDHDGNTKWVKRYNGPGNSGDVATAIAVDKNGNVYVTGRSITDGTGNDYATIKYDADGDLKWVQRYNGPANATDEAHAVTVDDNGNVYVTGMTTTFYTDDEDKVRTDIATIKYNTQGMQQWAQIYDNDRADVGKAIAVDGAGNVYITANGGAPDESYYSDFVTVKYNAAGVKQWAETVTPTGHAYEAEVYGLVLDAAGNVFITGGVGNGEFQDYVTIRYNTNGGRQWTAYYNGPGNGIDIATAIGMDKNGNVYVSGSSSIGYSDDYATIKYNAAGVQQWLKRYNGPALDQEGGYSQVKSIALDKDNNVYITGSVTRDNTGSDYATFKYDNNGNRKWKKIYNGPGIGHDAAIGLALDAQGNVYVTGTSTGNGTGDDIATIKYDKEGVTKWGKRYNGPGNGTDQAAAIATDNQGNIYVTGWSTGSGTGSDYVTIKYDCDGNIKWIKRYNGPGNMDDRATAMAVDTSGNVYVTGWSTSIGTYSDYTTIKYDGNGNVLWIARFNGPENGSDEAVALKLDASCNVYVTGNTGTLTDFATVKYNAAGVQQWVAIYNDPFNYLDFATALAVDGIGNVYVTGQSWGGAAGNDYATVKYNATGMQQWVARYNGFYDDAAIAMALDASGNVYVTGTSNSNGPLGNVATVKYNTAGAQQWVVRHAGDVGQAIAVDGNNNVYVGAGGPYTTIKYEQTPLLTRTATIPEQNNAVIADKTAARLNAKAFPNAFTEFINLQWSGSDKPVNITITDATGILVEKRTGLASSGMLKTGYNFPRGIYFAEIVQGPDKIVLKLIKH